MAQPPDGDVINEDIGIEYRLQKHEWTIAERGFGFDFAARIWEGVVTESDVTRPEDGESRFMATGKVDGQIITVVWTQRGNRRRIISAPKGVRKGAQFRDD